MYFFPVGEEVRGIVEAWVSYPREEKLWSHDDPLFPATRIELGASRQFEVTKLSRAHWSSATPIRGIFREAFQPAGLGVFQPAQLQKHTLPIRSGRAQISGKDQGVRLDTCQRT
jgi:hypothetical protein